jgi:hypothetical protein
LSSENGVRFDEPPLSVEKNGQNIENFENGNFDSVMTPGGNAGKYGNYSPDSNAGLLIAPDSPTKSPAKKVEKFEVENPVKA